MAKEKKEFKRLNRAVGVGEAVGIAIDPVFRKRGFASRDIISNWPSIAPKPYDKMSIPEKLHWPRGEAGAEGAVLFLRCADSHKLALAHEGQSIAASINRYFGYVLVGAVKLSPAPFTPGSGEKTETAPQADPETQKAVRDEVSKVGDDGVREALEKLGLGIMTSRR